MSPAVGSGPEVMRPPRPPPWVSARAVRAGARWAVLLALVAVAAWRVDWAGVGAALSAGSVELILVAAALNVASGVCKAMTWQGLVATLPGAAGRSRRGDLVSPLFVGALVNSVGVARAGDVVKVALARRALSRRGAEMPLADITGAMMAEHVVAMVAWGALIGGIAVLTPVPAAVWAAATSLALVCAAFLVATAPRVPVEGGCRIGGGAARWRRALRAVGRAWTAVHHSHRGLGRPPPRSRSPSPPSSSGPSPGWPSPPSWPRWGWGGSASPGPASSSRASPSPAPSPSPPAGSASTSSVPCSP
jgi:Lysylphosphatidylglycerol synthase TM region